MKETYPSASEVNNEFEADGDLSRIYGKANPNAIERTYANGFSYTADGKIQRLKLGNNRWESAKFNDRLQVTELALGTSDGDGTLWKLKYDYGELNTDGSVNTAKNTGNIAKQTITFNGLTNPLVQTFKYDSLYRLTEARETNGDLSNSSQTWKENFGYDRYGNRTGLEKYVGTTQIVNNNKTNPTIDPNTNRFNAGQNIYYDKNGNIIQDVGDQDAVRTFVFNGENKQRFVVQAGKNVGEYFYDGEGQRIKKVVYEPNGITVKEETIFVYSAGKLVEEYSTKTPPTNPTTSYPATDQLGSPRVITNSLGEVVSRRDFMPFGEEITNNIGERAATSLKYGVADGIRQKFTGYQKDEETGLDFAEARMYENRHGRFTAVDPLLASGKSANPQTFNRFTYCINNPLIFVDKDGLQVGETVEEEPGIIFGGLTRAYESFKKTFSWGGQSVTVREQSVPSDFYDGLSGSDLLQNASYQRFQNKLNALNGDSEAISELFRTIIPGRGASVDSVLQQTTDSYKTAETIANVGFFLSNLSFGLAGMVGPGSSCITTNSGVAVSRGRLPSTLDLFGGEESQIPGAINVDKIATSGVRASTTNLPFKSNYFNDESPPITLFSQC